jgi:hypothetical protein
MARNGMPRGRRYQLSPTAGEEKVAGDGSFIATLFARGNRPQSNAPSRARMIATIFSTIAAASAP